MATMAFHQIAVPHRDILSSSFSSEVYAAKLWNVYLHRGTDEYADAKTFFAKTYLTDNMKNELDSVRKRLNGDGGGHFRSISTPFGGGKTHTLIALYHKCSEWGAKPVVLVGTEIDPSKHTLWGLIEEQLTGKIARLSERIPHGGEALRSILEEQKCPILILIDELLQYITKADGINVNKTTLATQTIAFIQELSEAVSTLPNVCVVVTLPSSSNEQLDNARDAELDEKLKKIAGRSLDMMTPISDNDVPRIIRQRLFSNSDKQIRERAEKVVQDFVDYCDEQNLIPEGKQPSQYRDEFMESYPFLPHVIDVLYHRWGTITRFQRTRGVLRLLSRVINSMKTSDKDFITLADFDLSNDAIRGELVDLLDPQFNGVIAKDITDSNSGSAKVNQMIPEQYRGSMLGIRAATAIFMYSHSGGATINGAMESEVKRATCSRGIPAAQVGEVLNMFRNHLFYLSVSHDRYLFTKEANVLKIKMGIMDNIKQQELDDAERSLIKKNLGTGKKLRVTVWPTGSKDIENSAPLKLIIIRKNDPELIRSIYETVGESKRIYRNNIFFLSPSETARNQFKDSLKSKIAWEIIKNDPQIKLKADQADKMTGELKRESSHLDGIVKDYYSMIHIPQKEELQKQTIKPPAITDSGIDDIVFEYLEQNELVNTELGSMFLKNHYIQDKEFIETSNLWESMLSVPGERRPASKQVLQDAIASGVLDGEFGLGELKGGQPIPKYFQKHAHASFDPGEILISSSLCGVEEYPCTRCDYKATSKMDLENHLKSHEPQPAPVPNPSDLLQDSLIFGFNVPEGQINNISQMLLNIASHYKDLRLQITAHGGSMSKNDIEMIRETLKQIGADSDLL